MQNTKLRIIIIIIIILTLFLLLTVRVNLHEIIETTIIINTYLFTLVP